MCLRSGANKSSTSSSLRALRTQRQHNYYVVRWGRSDYRVYYGLFRVRICDWRAIVWLVSARNARNICSVPSVLLRMVLHYLCVCVCVSNNGASCDSCVCAYPSLALALALSSSTDGLLMMMLLMLSTHARRAALRLVCVYVCVAATMATALLYGGVNCYWMRICHITRTWIPNGCVRSCYSWLLMTPSGRFGPQVSCCDRTTTAHNTE